MTTPTIILPILPSYMNNMQSEMAIRNSKFIELIIAKLTSIGCILIEYISSRQIKYKCHCGNESQTAKNTILKKKWGGCYSCSYKRVQITIMNKYGVENIFQSEEIKTKSKATNLIRYGFEYPSKNVDIQNKIKKIINDKYGVENVFQSEEIKTKIRNININKYGVEFSAQRPEIKLKIKETNLDKYGCICPLQNADVHDKSIETNINKYGVENPTQCPEIQLKTKNTNLKKYGVECVFQNEDIKAKSIITSIEKYGVAYPMQNAEIQQKVQSASFLRKDYTMPSGKIIQVQGYEPYGLNLLLKYYDETDIINKDVPKFPYLCPNDDIWRVYYPDFYLISEHKIIEVKSIHTYKIEFAQNLAKFKAVIEEGYKMELMIFDDKGRLIKLIDSETEFDNICETNIDYQFTLDRPIEKNEIDVNNQPISDFPINYTEVDE